jgi:hypothetical protein
MKMYNATKPVRVVVRSMVRVFLSVESFVCVNQPVMCFERKV